MNEIYKYIVEGIPAGTIEKQAAIRLLEMLKLHEIKADNAAANNVYSSIKPAEKREYYPLSSAQKRLFIVSQFGEPTTAYNITRVVLMEGDVDIEFFNQIMLALIKRQESLRTSFEIIDGEPVQRIHDDIDFKASRIEAKEDEIKDKIQEFIRPHDFAKPPLFRIQIIKLNEKKYIVLYDMHHIITDGASMDIFVHEIACLYKGEKLNELEIQYKDFSVFQNNLFKSKAIKMQEEYWLDKFSGKIPILNMPTDFPRPAVMDYEGSIVTFEAAEELCGKLLQFTKETGITLYTVLLAAYYILLWKYTIDEDIIVGSPTMGRPYPELDNIIGMFINTLVLRNYPKGNKKYMDFLKEVKDSCLEAFKNQDYQFDELVKKLDLDRDLSRNPLFNTMFALQNIGKKVLKIKNIEMSDLDIPNNTTKFDLYLEAIEENGKIKFNLEYWNKLFKKETMERISKDYLSILEATVNNRDITLSKIELYSTKNLNISGGIEEKIEFEF